MERKDIQETTIMSAFSRSAHVKTSSTRTWWVTTHPLFTFFGLAYAITWGSIIGVMLAVGSSTVSVESLLVVR
jgi:hypothetical protein